MIPLLKRIKKSPNLQSALVKQAQKIYPETRKVALVFRASQPGEIRRQFRIYMTDKHQFFTLSCSETSSTTNKPRPFNLKPLDQDQFFHILINHGVPELHLPELEIN